MADVLPVMDAFAVMSILFVNFFGCKFLNFDNLI